MAKRPSDKNTAARREKSNDLNKSVTKIQLKSGIYQKITKRESDENTPEKGDKLNE